MTQEPHRHRNPVQATFVLRTLFAMLITSQTVSALTKINSHSEKPNIIVFYTDDHGYADLSCQGVVDDIKTPHVDSLAARGVHALHGYSTAPQCVPSRAGLLIGKFQSKFGVESNGSSLAGFNAEQTIAERLQTVGYVTAQFGKWHLGPAKEIVNHGFRHVFNQNSQAPFTANIDLQGNDIPLGVVRQQAYHIDACGQAAASLIDRYAAEPFFFYVAYRAPHVPLDAPQKYLDRFPGEMAERRRQALAMLSAVDDGVGLVVSKLQEHGLFENTLIFYIGDNGAPLKIHKYDAPGGGPGWDGSLNDPLNGEKGMLTEGGMHVPYVVSWPEKFPPQQTYQHPIAALDVTATAIAAAGIQAPTDELDGVNLIPFLSGKDQSAPHEALMWRWVSQSAIRKGKWKLLRGGDREYLFDLSADIEEKQNLLLKHSKVATELRQELRAWSETLQPPGLTVGRSSQVWNDYYDFYLDGKAPPPLREKFVPQSGSLVEGIPWTLRNGRLKKEKNSVSIISQSNADRQAPFLARNGLKLSGSIDFQANLKVSQPGSLRISWRTADQKEFIPRQHQVILSQRAS